MDFYFPMRKNELISLIEIPWEIGVPKLALREKRHHYKIITKFDQFPTLSLTLTHCNK
jgi:hypothetical protein